MRWIAAVSAVALVCFVAAPGKAATRLGIDINSAFAYPAVSAQFEPTSGNRLTVSITTSGDGVGISYRRLASAASFSFLTGPEVVFAAGQHALTAFVGYGFSYVFDLQAIQLSLQASLGLADRPAASGADLPKMTLGSRDFALTSLAGVQILATL
jgi:hypothetical protein